MSEGLCTSCGAAVNLAAETEVKCDYCGTMVKPPEAEARFNELMQSKVGGAFMLADTALESGDFEAALNYYNKAIEADPTSAEAWFRKGFCIVRVWLVSNPQATKEALASWKNAIQFSKNKEAAKKRAATLINNSMVAGLKEYFKSGAFGDEYAFMAKTHEDHLLNIEAFLAVALEYEPSSIDVAKNGLTLCDLAKDACGEKYSATRLRQASIKYEQLLAIHAPDFLRQEQVEKQANQQLEVTKAEKQNSENQSAVGCLMFGCCILLVIFSLLCVVALNEGKDSNSFISQTGPLYFLGVVAMLISIIKLYFAKKSPESSARMLNKIKTGVDVGAAAAAAVVLHEIDKKERNKPLTKGDLEDFKAEQRRKERGY